MIFCPGESGVALRLPPQSKTSPAGVARHLIFSHPPGPSWTAPAERSGDGAFGYTLTVD